MHIRVIAPSMSLARKTEDEIQLGKKNLESLGFSVSFGKHVLEIDEFGSSPISSRITDLHEAYLDNSVDIILCATGGFNTNQLLPYINWDTIAANPKKLCGYSDITVLLAAIYAKTGQITYSSPNYSSFCHEKLNTFQTEHFINTVQNNTPLTLNPSPTVQDWGLLDADDQEIELPNTGYWIMHEGVAEGVIIGENLCTLNLLQGTDMFPSLKNSILCIEDDDESKDGNFIRDLQSILMMPGADTIEGILIGRFQVKSKIGKEKLTNILNTFPQLNTVPIIANVDFGHTSPRITLPIGGKIHIKATQNPEIAILN